MKKISKLLTFTALCLGMPLLNACSFFRTEENEAVGIKEIIAELDDDGNTVITIYYTDEDIEPVSFTLPKGADGQEGNGIKSIEYTQDEYGLTTVTIKFTNTDMDDVVFTLSPGKSISDVIMEMDDDGNTVIYFIDSDGNRLDPITVYKGDTGEAGIGISEMVPDYHDDGSVTITVTLTDGSSYSVDIPAPLEGRGISYVVSSKLGNKYVLTIYYTDGTSEDIEFDAPPSWTTGSSRPSDTYGYDGDFFFDLSHDIIYIKQDGTWIVAVDFNTDSTTYTVTFDLNDTTAQPASFAIGTSTYTGIKRGETFYSLNYTVPVPARATYTFAGWSTSRTPNPTNGLFTDLTPVLSNMTLYAIWSN